MSSERRAPGARGAGSPRRGGGAAGTQGRGPPPGCPVPALPVADLAPSASAGALLRAGGAGGTRAPARRGSGAPFVVEADEYAGNFDAYRPAIAIVTSAEWDHPDVFADRGAVISAFDAWLRTMHDGATEPDEDASPPVAVIHVGDAGAAVLAAGLDDWTGR